MKLFNVFGFFYAIFWATISRRLSEDGARNSGCTGSTWKKSSFYRYTLDLSIESPSPAVWVGARLGTLLILVAPVKNTFYLLIGFEHWITISCCLSRCRARNPADPGGTCEKHHFFWMLIGFERWITISCCLSRCRARNPADPGGPCEKHSFILWMLIGFEHWITIFCCLSRCRARNPADPGGPCEKNV